uniref:Uncharacterized protein n=1 Tax=Opuntia streptacantha TaxID=393608 RepID=A0A7C8YTL7_OPUST
MCTGAKFVIYMFCSSTMHRVLILDIHVTAQYDYMSISQRARNRCQQVFFFCVLVNHTSGIIFASCFTESIAANQEIESSKRQRIIIEELILVITFSNKNSLQQSPLYVSEI